MEVSIYRNWVSQVKKRRDGTSESQAYKVDKKASGKLKDYVNTACYRPLLKDSQKKKGWRGELVNVHYYFSTGVPGAIHFCTHFSLYFFIFIFLVTLHSIEDLSSTTRD